VVSVDTKKKVLVVGKKASGGKDWQPAGSPKQSTSITSLIPQSKGRSLRAESTASDSDATGGAPATGISRRS
jgi:hypothetical protein